MNDEDEFDEAQLQMLREQVKSLPTEVVPNSASWANIRDRIERSRVRALPTSASAAEVSAHRTEAVSQIVEPHIKWWRAPRTVTLVAASLFAAVTTVVVLRENGEQPVVAASGDSGAIIATSTVGGPVAPAVAPEVPNSTVAATTRPLDASIAAVLAEFNAAALDLTKDLDARRSRMQPDALAVVDSCLRTIDQAIQESRTALVHAPKNATIVELLQVTYQQKLDLLRRAADLPMVSLQE